ncbi:UNVERIFIED_CONTAM: hypothetical protein GTU68_024009 [Idotea baltica]|nr:hypothetical protein [Idotea baltica]
MEKTKQHTAIWEILESVTDPEIPVLSILDLGIVRDVKVEADEVSIIITPTYSGCPAMNMIEVEIRKALKSAGYTSIKVNTILSPAWTTAWLTENGKEKLRAYGIAPPEDDSPDVFSLWGDSKAITCPHCGAKTNKLISQFGSTACKALYQCTSCLEPFDYFKCH